MQNSSRIQPFKLVLAGASPATDANIGSTPVVHVAQLDLERHRAKVEAAGATPAVDTNLPLCLSSHRSGFVNRYSSVQVRPGAPVSNQDRGVISSISPCEGDGPGANPGFLTNFDGPKLIDYPPIQRRAYRLG